MYIKLAFEMHLKFNFSKKLSKGIYDMVLESKRAELKITHTYQDVTTNGPTFHCTYMDNPREYR